MNPPSPASLGIIVGLVAALRKEWPSLDGRVVYFVTLALSLAVAFLSAESLVAYRANTVAGLVLAASAVATVSAFNYGVAKVGAAFGTKSVVVSADQGADAGGGPDAPGMVIAKAEAKKQEIFKALVDEGKKLARMGLVFKKFVVACSAGVVGAAFVFIVLGCPSGAVKSAIDEGCSLIPVTDGAGQAAATICEALSPVLAPIVASELEKLRKKLGNTTSVGAMAGTFVPLVHGGKQVGYVRTDIADGVQAGLDAVVVK